MLSDKISIIVPIYRVENYIGKCIDSIIRQTYNNLEIILVNDGSPDNCGKICDEYAKLDNRIKVIHKENGGLSDARNVGIEAASGKYIAFVDGDDYIHPQMYELMYNSIIENDADISVCRYKSVKEEESEKYEQINNVEWVVLESDKDKFEYSLGPNTIVCFTVAWNKLYKAEIFNDICYPYGKIHEDEFTTYKTIERAKKIVYTDNELYYYVQRDGSIMNKAFDKRRLWILDAFQERLELYNNTKRFDWYEKMLSQYRLMMMQWTDLLMKEDEKKLEWLKPYKRYYNFQVIKNVWNLPVKMKKIGYLQYAFFPKSYFRKKYNRKT